MLLLLLLLLALLATCSEAVTEVLHAQKAPQLPLAPPLTPEAVFNASLAAVALAWPNTSTSVSPIVCPTCAAASLTPIYCASARIAGALRPGSGASVAGDGFAYLFANQTAALQAVANLGENGVYNVDYMLAPTILGGANAWLLNWWNLTLPIQVPIFYDIVRVPDAIWQGGFVSNVVLNSYLLDTQGYDCVFDGQMQTAVGNLYAQYALAQQSAGFTVVAQLPRVQPVGAIRQLFTWTQPFSGPIWALIVATFVFSAVLMVIFESSENGGVTAWNIGHFAPQDGQPPSVVSYLVHALYISFSHFVTSNCEMFYSVTLPGRLYRVTYSFSILVIVSSYVAKLAAVLSSDALPVALITDIADFEAKNLKACVLNRTDDLTFVGANYANTPLHIVDSVFESAVLPLIQSGVCAGAIVPNVGAQFALSPNADPSGSFCSLDLVGLPLNQVLNAIPFRSDFSLAQLSALSGLVNIVVADGSYNQAMDRSNNFLRRRPNCATGGQQVTRTTAAEPLTVTNYAGVFVIIAIGACMSSVLYLTTHHQSKRVAREAFARLNNSIRGGDTGAAGSAATHPTAVGEKAVDDAVLASPPRRISATKALKANMTSRLAQLRSHVLLDEHDHVLDAARRAHREMAAALEIATLQMNLIRAGADADHSNDVEMTDPTCS